MSSERPTDEAPQAAERDEVLEALEAGEKSQSSAPPVPGFVTWFAGHHVAANLLMLFLMVSGALALLDTTVEVFPEFSIDTITVRVPYLGASPAETEEGVVVRVEEAIASIEGIERIRATASEGVGLVTIELDEDADNERVLQDVKAAVDRIDTFPAETEQPIVSEILNRRQVMSVVLYGEVGREVLSNLAERVRDDLTTLDAISQAEIEGLPPREISIEVSELALRRNGLTFDQVANAVRRSSIDLPGGSLETAGGQILLRTDGQRYVGREFEEVVLLSASDGTRVLLGDVATVLDGFEDTDEAARFDGQPAVLVQLYRTGDEGALDVTRAARDYIEENRGLLPAGVQVATWQDSSKILDQRIGLLVRNALLGLLLVFVTLALFLDLRLAFWTTMGIPISFLGGLWLLPQMGVTINMISLFAFIVSLGIVVDDAIVVGENVFAKLQQGLPPMRAAVDGVREMAAPVTFAVLTSVAAFMPLVLVEGTIGKVMRNIPLVVIAVLLMSLIESVLILPAHLSSKHSPAFLKPVLWLLGPFLRLLDIARGYTTRALQSFIKGPYHSLIEGVIRWRYLTVASCIAALLLVGGTIAGGYLKFTFMPDIDADNMVAYLKMPEGTPVEQTAAIAQRLEDTALEVGRAYDAERAESLGDDAPPIIEHYSTTVGGQPTAGGGGPTSSGSTGGGGSHLAEVNMELLASEVRGIASTEIMSRWREKVGEVPGAVALTYTSSLFSAGDKVSVQLAHRDFDQLLLATEKLKSQLGEYPGVLDVADSFESGKKEIRLELTAEGRALGLTLADLARQVRQGFYGEEAQRIQRGRDDIRVMVRYPEIERRSLGDLEQMRVRLADGSQIPLATVAELRDGRGFAQIDRVDRRRVVTVTSDVDDRLANANEINQNLRVEVLPGLLRDFPGLAFDFEGEQRQQSESLGSMRNNFIVALFVIFALLAIPFRSYTQPLIVMSVIPFGFLGAVIGHLMMGLNLTLLSFFGVVALTGVVVNDSLIMIDLINRERRAGIPLDIAIRDAGKRRFRPIFLTTVTTFMGLTPMIFETSLQARFLIPMAVSLGFGIVFATALTLLLVPAVYRILEDFHDLFGSSAVASIPTLDDPPLDDPARQGEPSDPGGGHGERPRTESPALGDDRAMGPRPSPA